MIAPEGYVPATLVRRRFEVFCQQEDAQRQIIDLLVDYQEALQRVREPWLVIGSNIAERSFLDIGAVRELRASGRYPQRKQVRVFCEEASVDLALHFEQYFFEWIFLAWAERHETLSVYDPLTGRVHQTQVELAKRHPLESEFRATFAYLDPDSLTVTLSEWHDFEARGEGSPEAMQSLYEEGLVQARNQIRLNEAGKFAKALRLLDGLIWVVDSKDIPTEQEISDLSVNWIADPTLAGKSFIECLGPPKLAEGALGSPNYTPSEDAFDAVIGKQRLGKYADFIRDKHATGFGNNPDWENTLRHEYAKYVCTTPLSADSVRKGCERAWSSLYDYDIKADARTQRRT